MATLQIKPADACKYDLLVLGEIMLRLDPGAGHIGRTRTIKVCDCSTKVHFAPLGLMCPMSCA